MQLLGSAIGCLFGDSLDTLISLSLVSYLLAYVLYLWVIVSQKEGLMAVAIGFYAVYAVATGFYAVLNAMHTVSSLVFVIPPLVYGIKALACGYCAFYAYQIRDRKYAPPTAHRYPAPRRPPRLPGRLVVTREERLQLDPRTHPRGQREVVEAEAAEEASASSAASGIFDAQARRQPAEAAE